MKRIFERFERLCFNGHTHVPGVFTEDGKFLSPAEIGNKYTLAGTKAMFNVGSVGQPRDGDWRAAYCIYDIDPGVVEERRVKYDLQTAQKKIIDAELPRLLAERLAIGR